MYIARTYAKLTDLGRAYSKCVFRMANAECIIIGRSLFYTIGILANEKRIGNEVSIWGRSGLSSSSLLMILLCHNMADIIQISSESNQS
jgi:hypothetical protein